MRYIVFISLCAFSNCSLVVTHESIEYSHSLVDSVDSAVLSFCFLDIYRW